MKIKLYFVLFQGYGFRSSQWTRTILLFLILLGAGYAIVQAFMAHR